MTMRARAAAYHEGKGGCASASARVAAQVRGQGWLCKCEGSWERAVGQGNGTGCTRMRD